jgi:hypothetical protein
VGYGVMANFVCTDQGYINLAYVGRITPRGSYDGPTTLYAPDGTVLGTTLAWDTISDQTAHIIPPQPGQTVVVVQLDMSPTGPRPTARDLSYRHEPVAAWRVHTCKSVEPVLFAKDADRWDMNSKVLLPLPDGRAMRDLFTQETFADLSEAMDALLAVGIEEWEQKQEKAA